MTDTDLIIDALSRVHDSQQEMNARLSKILEDHETRLRAAEKSILSFKTLGTAITSLAAFFGWEWMKSHLFR